MENNIFFTCQNERLFHRLLQSRRRDGATYEDLLGVLRSSQETMRTDSITGIRIKYTDGRILTSPVIGQRELEASSIPRSRRTNCTKSDIKYIGGSDPYGRLTSVYKSFLELQSPRVWRGSVYNQDAILLYDQEQLLLIVLPRISAKNNSSSRHKQEWNSCCAGERMFSLHQKQKFMWRFWLNAWISLWAPAYNNCYIWRTMEMICSLYNPHIKVWVS